MTDIPLVSNGHFEKIGAWLQILKIVRNSTLFYLLLDTHDSPAPWVRPHMEVQTMGLEF